MTTVLPAPGSADVVPRPSLATTPDPHTTSRRKRPPTLADRGAPVDHCFLPIQALLCTELWLVVRRAPLTLLTFPPSSPSVLARADLILRENQGASVGGRMELAGLHARLCCAQRPPALESTLGSDAHPARRPSPTPPTRGTSCCEGPRRGLRRCWREGPASRGIWRCPLGLLEPEVWGVEDTPEPPCSAALGGPWARLPSSTGRHPPKTEEGDRATCCSDSRAPRAWQPCPRAGRVQGATGGGAQGGRADTGGSETSAAAVRGRPHPAGEQWCGPAWGGAPEETGGPPLAPAPPAKALGASQVQPLGPFRWDLQKACGSGSKPRPAPPHLRLTKLPSGCS